MIAYLHGGIKLVTIVDDQSTNVECSSFRPHNESYSFILLLYYILWMTFIYETFYSQIQNSLFDW